MRLHGCDDYFLPGSSGGCHWFFRHYLWTGKAADACALSVCQASLALRRQGAKAAPAVLFACVW